MEIKLKHYIHDFMELSKVRIAVLATISTAAGYILATGKLTAEILWPVIGIFILSSSSCALNQVQDRKLDARMERTQNRPLPSGRISLWAAWVYVLVSFIIGTSVLYFGANLIAASLGLLAMFWYNVVYMYLKRVSSLAVIPGALVGAIPPMVGWAASAKTIWDPYILSLAFLFFIWQIPHFWLLVLKFGTDYEKAGLPSLMQIFTSSQLGRITFVWIAATGVTGILIPLCGNIHSLVIVILLLMLSFWLVGTSTNLLNSTQSSPTFIKVFKNINIYILLVIMILTIGKLLSLGNPGLTLLVER